MASVPVFGRLGSVPCEILDYERFLLLGLYDMILASFIVVYEFLRRDLFF